MLSLRLQPDCLPGILSTPLEAHADELWEQLCIFLPLELFCYVTKQEVSVPTPCEFRRLLRPEAALDRHLSAHPSGESDKKSVTSAQATKRRLVPL